MNTNDLHASILLALSHRDGVPLAMLRKQLDVSMSVLTREVSQLGALGVVERRAHGKRDCLFLTDAGRTLLTTGARA
ncbi:MAG: MarR family winged helix-turn-helix transcriptional regulator [Rhodocyclaceae bacterium]